MAYMTSYNGMSGLGSSWRTNQSAPAWQGPPAPPAPAEKKGWFQDLLGGIKDTVEAVGPGVKTGMEIRQSEREAKEERRRRRADERAGRMDMGMISALLSSRNGRGGGPSTALMALGGIVVVGLIAFLVMKKK